MVTGCQLPSWCGRWLVIVCCCVQLLSEMDDLIEWFGETERQIADAEPIVCDAERLRELSRDHKVILSSYVISDAALIKWQYNTMR